MKLPVTGRANPHNVKGLGIVVVVSVYLATPRPAHLASIGFDKSPALYSVANLNMCMSLDDVQVLPSFLGRYGKRPPARGFCIGFIICPALWLLLKPLRVIRPVIVNFGCPITADAFLVALSTTGSDAFIKAPFLAGASADVADSQFVGNVKH
jgi:hypothetical protein